MCLRTSTNRRRHDAFGEAALHRRLRYLVAGALVALLLAGCGTTSRSHSITSAAPGHSTTPPNGLVVCVPGFNSAGNDDMTLELLTDGSTGAARMPLLTVGTDCPSYGDDDSVYLYSPNLTEVAGTSSESDGSNVAGYFVGPGGAFVNLSGHSSKVFTDMVVDDQTPIFDPVTGDLWWSRGNEMWSAPLHGGSARPEGPGMVAGFTPQGAPLRVPLVSSPDGSISATYADNTWGTLVPTPVDITLGPTTASTTKCTESTLGASACPNVATLEPANCFDFDGFVSDKSFVCFDGEHYDLETFTLDGTTATVTGSLQLTPNTSLSIEGGLVDPSGKRLWFTDRGGALYVIPTTSPTAEPTPTSVSVGQQTMGGSAFAAGGFVVGWCWNGKMQPAAYPLWSS